MFDYVPYVHNKTGNVYIAICEVTNATNANDGERMVLYARDNKFYVRNVDEFMEKFTRG